MKKRELYSIEEARELLGGISRNTIYAFLRSGDLASVVIGCRRFIAAAAIEEFVQASTTRVSPSQAAVRDRMAMKQLAMLPAPPRVPARAAQRGQHAILPSLQKR
jgi:excisionase family DNA binding protein